MLLTPPKRLQIDPNNLQMRTCKALNYLKYVIGKVN